VARTSAGQAVSAALGISFPITRQVAGLAAVVCASAPPAASVATDARSARAVVRSVVIMYPSFGCVVGPRRAVKESTQRRRPTRALGRSAYLGVPVVPGRLCHSGGNNEARRRFEQNGAFCSVQPSRAQ